MSTPIRRLALPLGLLVLGLPAGIGVVMAMGDDELPQEATAAFMPISQKSVPSAERSAQARWERVGVFRGAGPAEHRFVIADDAVQWRAGWRCESGALRLAVARDAQDAQALVDDRCPDAGTQESTGTGPGTVRVDASAPWQVVVEQQVDTALEEPPLAGMTAGSLISRGTVRGVQKQGEGTVALHRLADGRLALRFEDFYTSPSPGLRLWLSEATDPRSTLAARKAQRVDAGTLRSTFGNFNQVLPRDVDADAIKSIVIWCPAVTIAFSAGRLSAG